MDVSTVTVFGALWLILINQWIMIVLVFRILNHKKENT